MEPCCQRRPHSGGCHRRYLDVGRHPARDAEVGELGGSVRGEHYVRSYGAIVCVLSAVVCAVWSFVEYQFLFPGAVAEAFEQMYTQLGQMGSMMPENFTDILLKMEDNYAQINCISTFVWCSIFGLLVSAILARSSAARKSVFTDEEMRQSGDDEFNF